MLRVAERRRGERVVARPQDCEIGERVATDDVGHQLASVGERRAHAARALDDVRRRQQKAVRGYRDRAAAAASRTQARDRRAQPLDDAHDRLRVRVERLLVRQRLGDEREIHALDGSSCAKVSGVLEIETVDYHTAGEPFRIVTGGVDAPRGATILAQRRDAAARLDDVRRLLVNEPRGHADMYGCFVTAPEDDGADLGVVFFHNAGYSTACGHGTIALVTWALESGVLPVTGENTRVVVDAPSVRLETVARVHDGDVRSVRFRNVPSFVWGRDVLPGVDVAFGGAFYAFVEERVSPGEVTRLISRGRELKAALEAEHDVVHPLEPEL